MKEKFKVKLNNITLHEWNQIDMALNKREIDVHIVGDQIDSDNLPKYIMVDTYKAWVYGVIHENTFKNNQYPQINQSEFLGELGLYFEEPIKESNAIIPSHYNTGKQDVIDVCKILDLNFNRGNVLKYISRAGKKDDELQDLQKALEYLKREIDYIKEKRNNG